MAGMDGDTWKLIIILVIAIVGGNVGSVVNAFSPTVRDDPFTGAQGDMLERRIDTLEAKVATVLWRLKTCEGVMEECK